MDERQFQCIRDLVNFARISERQTKALVRSRMIAAGWTDEEIKAAIEAVKAPSLPVSIED